MKTISEYFSAMDPAEGFLNIEVLAYGQFPDIPEGKCKRWPYWTPLFEACGEVIKEFAAVEFQGGPTCGMVMDLGMKRYLKRCGATYQGGHWHMPNDSQRVPPVWVYTIAQLNKLPREIEGGA